MDTRRTFRVGDWLVRPGDGAIEHQLSGNRVTLRPKVMDMLVLLASAQGRVISREELLSRGWPETIASDETLSRCIADLRKVLRDPDQDDNPVQTVPKRGYRLVWPVTEAGESPDSVQSAVIKSAPAKSWVWLAAALLVTIILVVWFSRDTREAHSQAVTLAVYPLELRSDSDASLNLLARAIEDLVVQDLSAVDSIRLRRPYGFDPAGDLAQQARDVGASHAISGTLVLETSSDKAQLSMQVHDLNRKPTVVSQLGRYDLPLLISEEGIERFLALRDQVAEAAVSELLPALSLESNARLSPHNIQAYRLYLQARDLLAQPGCDGTGPNVLLEQSLELDPIYAPAWVALGWARYGLIATCGLGGSYYAEAVEAADKALAIIPDYVPALGLKATILVETARAPEAINLMRGAMKERPGSPDLNFALSYAACFTGDLATAEQALDATLKQDPFFLVANGWTPNVLLYQGRTEEFLEHLPATESTLFGYYRAYAMALLGQEEAHNVADRAWRINPGGVFGRLSGALMNVLEDRPDEALRVLRQLAEERKLLGMKDGEISYKLAQLAASAGDAELASEQLAEAWSLGFQCAECLANDAVLAGYTIP